MNNHLRHLYDVRDRTGAQITAMWQDHVSNFGGTTPANHDVEAKRYGELADRLITNEIEIRNVRRQAHEQECV